MQAEFPLKSLPECIIKMSKNRSSCICANKQKKKKLAFGWNTMRSIVLLAYFDYVSTINKGKEVIISILES